MAWLGRQTLLEIAGAGCIDLTKGVRDYDDYTAGFRSVADHLVIAKHRQASRQLLTRRLRNLSSLIVWHPRVGVSLQRASLPVLQRAENERPNLITLQGLAGSIKALS
jgi:hypothetical protein